MEEEVVKSTRFHEEFIASSYSSPKVLTSGVGWIAWEAAHGNLILSYVILECEFMPASLCTCLPFVMLLFVLC